jgi:hypothetical protein
MHFLFPPDATAIHFAAKNKRWAGIKPVPRWFRAEGWMPQIAKQRVQSQESKRQSWQAMRQPKSGDPEVEYL